MYMKKTIMEESDVLFSTLNTYFYFYFSQDYFSDAVRFTLPPKEIDFQIM